MPDVITIAADPLRDFLGRILAAFGCDADNAAQIADGLVEADLRGHRIQGTDHIYSIIADLKAGRINGSACPRVISETIALAHVDGDGGAGHVGGRFAVDLAVETAREAGIGAVGLVRAGDIFLLGAYVERIARAGLVGLVFTNTVPRRVHPAGGIDRALGTNPIGFAFPTGDGDPIVMDLATSTTAVGHVRLASYHGAAIPAGVAIDRDGRPTTDALEALDGALTPLGGHKGFALALAGALLTGPVIGAEIGDALDEQVGADAPPNRGHVFLAIDPAVFGPIEAYHARVAAYVAELKSGRKAPGVEAILMPGERSLGQRRRSLVTGITMDTAIWQHTLDFARDAGVEPPQVD
jgi:LDH2 family malate/lactate/ureidoglycolate dehydrogenase